MTPSAPSTTRPLVIGVGNRWRSDDGVGPVVAAALARLDDLRADVVTVDGEPARTVAAWEDRTCVVVVDAIVAGAEPGTIHRVDEIDRLPAPTAQASSHGAGILAAVELGRALGRLPDRLVVLGVEPARSDHGEELSPSVAAAIGPLLDAVIDTVDRLTAPEVSPPCA